MTKAQDNPHQPAFPVTAGNQVYAIGMTLRDWFATEMDGLSDEATQPYAATFNTDPWPQGYLEQAKWWAKADATLRYIRADAMLAAHVEGGDA